MNRRMILSWLRGILVCVCAVLATRSMGAGITMEEIEEKIRKTDRPDAPDFDGAVAWINSDKPLKIADLKGKIVLLDFWTFG